MTAEFLIAFTALFVALDIIGTVPIYLSLTESLDRNQRYLIVNKSMGVALLVAIIFMFAGQPMFRHLGISLNDFKIAGGLILLLIALAELLGGPHSVRPTSGETGIVPLAVPLITGPGVLTTLLLQSASIGYLVTAAALLLNYLIAWQILRHCDRITQWIGKEGTVVLSKIAALLLAAIAVSMIRIGTFESLGDFLRTLNTG